MKSSLRSDEIFGVPPQMKLNPSSYPDEVGFHRVAISSTAGGFLPQKADLVEKREQVKDLLSFFLRCVDKKDAVLALFNQDHTYPDQSAPWVRHTIHDPAADYGCVPQYMPFSCYIVPIHAMRTVLVSDLYAAGTQQ